MSDGHVNKIKILIVYGQDTVTIIIPRESIGNFELTDSGLVSCAIYDKNKMIIQKIGDDKQ